MSEARAFLAAVINALLIFIIFILRYSCGVTLGIGQAVPIILIPLVISCAIFYGENAAMLAGFFAGVLMDSSSASGSWFNALFLTLGALVCGFLSSRVLNRNFKAAICLSVGFSFGYFFVKYLIFFVFEGIPVSYDYFLLDLIPSAVYTAAWLIPFYFLQKKLSNS